MVYPDWMERATSWNPTLFGGAAEFYDQGRMPHAEGMSGAIRQNLGADGSGRLLDVGCGPGSIALRLTDAFREIVGLDADPAMVSEARRIARARSITNAQFINALAEDLPLDLGRFDMITFASSFHWMDRVRVAAAVYSMLELGGAVVQVDRGGRVDVKDAPYPPVPGDLIQQLVHQHLGAISHPRKYRGSECEMDEEEVWRRAGFMAGVSIRVRDARLLVRTIDDLIAETLSYSVSAPHLFGENLASFRNEMRAALQSASPTGRFSVALADTCLYIWRPAG